MVGGTVQRSDEELMVAIAAGPGALPEFYRRHVAKVIGIGARRFDRAEDVADFVADVFVELIGSAHRFDPRRGTAIGFLYGLAANVAAAQRRRRARTDDAHRRLSGRAMLDADDYERVEEQVDAANDLRTVYRAMEALSGDDRRLLELVAVDGLAPADAAKIIGVSPIAARVRLARARQRLRTAINAAANNAAGISPSVADRPVTARAARKDVP
jgi:RNA polymerase sigma factor (sigma-70 family)